MNNKKVVYTALAIVILFFCVSLFITLKNKIGKNKEGVNVTIKCVATEQKGDLKVNDTFKCKLLTYDYTFKVQSIENDKMVIKASDYGLSKVYSSGGIDLTSRVDTFELTKGEKLTLAPQVMDAYEELVITWN